MKHERYSVVAEQLHRQRSANAWLRAPLSKRLGAAVLVASCALGAACTAEIDGSMGKHGSSASPGGTTPGGGGSGTSTPGAPGELSLPGGDAPVARMHKLTASEFANGVHDLLGADAPL